MFSVEIKNLIPIDILLIKFTCKIFPKYEFTFY